MDEAFKYTLELGVDSPRDIRVCVVEMGPSRSSTFAIRTAVSVRGKTYREVLAMPGAYEYDGAPDLLDLPIVGATLNRFTNKFGTDEDTDLY